MGQATKLRIRLVRGELEIRTYSPGAKGAKRNVGRIITAPGELARTLDNPAIRERLGLNP